MNVRCETHIKVDTNKDDAKKLKDWASNIPDSAQIRITQGGNIWAYWDEERPTTQMPPGVKKVTAKGIHTTVWFNNGSFICACGTKLGSLPNLREIT